MSKKTPRNIEVSARLVGGGTHSVSVCSCLSACKRLGSIIGVIDPLVKNRVSVDFGIPHFGNDECAINHSDKLLLVNALGLNVNRTAVIGLLNRYLENGHGFFSVMANSSIIDPTSKQGVGCFAGEYVYVGPFTKLDDFSTVNTGAIIEHHAQVGKGAFIAPKAVVLGGATIGQGAVIGAGAIVLPNAHVPNFTRIKAGSVFGGSA